MQPAPDPHFPLGLLNRERAARRSRSGRGRPTERTLPRYSDVPQQVRAWSCNSGPSWPPPISRSVDRGRCHPAAAGRPPRRRYLSPDLCLRPLQEAHPHLHALRPRQHLLRPCLREKGPRGEPSSRRCAVSAHPTGTCQPCRSAAAPPRPSSREDDASGFPEDPDGDSFLVATGPSGPAQGAQACPSISPRPRWRPV